MAKSADRTSAPHRSGNRTRAGQTIGERQNSRSGTTIGNRTGAGSTDATGNRTRPAGPRSTARAKHNESKPAQATSRSLAVKSVGKRVPKAEGATAPSSPTGFNAVVSKKRPSLLARQATEAFHVGVQGALRDLSRHRIAATVVTKSGLTVTAVPKQRSGQFIVEVARRPGTTAPNAGPARPKR